MDEQKNTAGHMNKNNLAVFAYLWVFIFIPFLTNEKNDPFVKFHLKQGLTLLIFEVAGWLLGMVIGWMPMIGLLMTLWWLVAIVFAVMGIMNVMNGREKELPYIGRYAKRFNF